MTYAHNTHLKFINVDDVHKVVCAKYNNNILDMQDILIPYTLDVMHCEQNFAKNILKTMTGQKRTVKIRQDLQRRRIKRHLLSQPSLMPLNTFGHFSILARVTSANPSHLAMLMVGSPYCGTIHGGVSNLPTLLLRLTA